jgi:hypothetical protein
MLVARWQILIVTTKGKSKHLRTLHGLEAVRPPLRGLVGTSTSTGGTDILETRITSNMESNNTTAILTDDFTLLDLSGAAVTINRTNRAN